MSVSGRFVFLPDRCCCCNKPLVEDRMTKSVYCSACATPLEVTIDRHGQKVFHDHEARRRQFRIEGSWRDTVSNGPFPLAENITRREIEQQSEVHRE